MGERLKVNIIFLERLLSNFDETWLEGKGGLPLQYWIFFFNVNNSKKFKKTKKLKRNAEVIW